MENKPIIPGLMPKEGFLLWVLDQDPSELTCWANKRTGPNASCIWRYAVEVLMLPKTCFPYSFRIYKNKKEAFSFDGVPLAEFSDDISKLRGIGSQPILREAMTYPYSALQERARLWMRMTDEY